MCIVLELLKMFVHEIMNDTVVNGHNTYVMDVLYR